MRRRGSHVLACAEKTNGLRGLVVLLHRRTHDPCSEGLSCTDLAVRCADPRPMKREANDTPGFTSGRRTSSTRLRFGGIYDLGHSGMPCCQEHPSSAFGLRIGCTKGVRFSSHLFILSYRRKRSCMPNPLAGCTVSVGFASCRYERVDSLSRIPHRVGYGLDAGCGGMNVETYIPPSLHTFIHQ